MNIKVLFMKKALLHFGGIWIQKATHKSDYIGVCDTCYNFNFIKNAQVKQPCVKLNAEYM